MLVAACTAGHSGSHLAVTLLHAEELRKVYCLENAMGSVSVHSCAWKRERKTLFGSKQK